jgi:hypothetical protein
MLTQVKAVGIYTIPRIDVQIAGTYQSIPGSNDFEANFNVPSAVAAQSLGRPLSGNQANVQVNVLAPETQYNERINQLDLRFGKIVRFGRTRSTISLDIFNALNIDTVLTVNENFATWLRPNTIIQSRFFKVSAQVDF